MVSLETISEGVDQGKLYYLSEIAKIRTRLKKGARYCSFGELICVNRWIKALEYDVAQELNDEGTQAIYKLLMESLNGFGASYAIDPNVDIPGTTIIVNIISDGKPSWFDFDWSEMTDEVDGAKYVYTNPILNGWNPSLQTGTTLLYRGVDYDMYEGGIIKLRAGKGIYEGQSIRADNFQPYDAPPIPVVEVGVALIQNNSSQSVNYNDNFGGLTALPAGEDYFKDPIIDDQTLYVQFPNGTTLTYNCYNSDGSLFQTLTLNAPPSTGFTSANMELTKRYEFIITNT